MKTMNLASTVLIFLSFYLAESQAASPGDSTSGPVPGKSHSFRIEVSFFGGGGREQIEVGKTTENEMITISPGGGVGAKIGVGYFLLPLLDANLEIGMQNSAFSKKVENA